MTKKIDSNQQAVSLVRDGHLINMTMPGFKLQFDTNYGGTPLSWFAASAASETIVTNPFPGAAASVNWVFGQDPTQASPNGPDYFPISTLNNPNPTLAFYAREVAFCPPNESQPNAVYQVSGYAPVFWISLYEIDDSIPVNPDYSDNGWVTLYHNVANLPDSTFTYFGTPIFYQGGTAHPEGIVLLANKILPTNLPWYARMANFFEGRIACQVKISLKEVDDDARAGIVFRREVPADSSASYLDAYNSPGYSLIADRSGVLEIFRFDGSGNEPVIVWGGAVIPEVAQTIISDDGAMLELRSDNCAPNKIDIWIEGRYYDTYTDSDCILGEQIGLYAKSDTSEGLIKFGWRYFFNIGQEFNAVYTGTPEGFLELDLSISNAAGVTKPQDLYRTALPGVFLTTDITAPVQRAWREDGTEIDLKKEFPNSSGDFSGIVPILSTPSNVYAMWDGEADGSAGLFTIPTLAQSQWSSSPFPYCSYIRHAACRSYFERSRKRC